VFIGDSRKPRGPGILPLQHHGHRSRGWELDARACILATRIVDRLDGNGEMGQYVYEDRSYGDLVGALLWGKDTRETSGWSFAWPVSTTEKTEITPPATIGSGGTSGGPGALTGPAGEATPGTRNPIASTVGAFTPSGHWEGGVYYDPPPGAQAFAEMVNSTPNFGKEILAAAGGAGGGGGGGNAPEGGKDGKTQTEAKAVADGGNKVGEKASWFGFGEEWLNPWPNAGAVGGQNGKAPNVFGQGKEWLNPVYPWGYGNPRAPFGIGVDAYSIGIVGHRDLRVKKNKDGKKTDKEENAAWIQILADSFEYEPLEIFPTRSDWGGDTRYEGIVPSVPVYYPRIPKGFHGIALSSTEEDEQVELFHPTDPRLIAAHRGGADYGSIVTDVAGNYVDTSRAARLQSVLRVVRGPSGVQGGSANAIALNIGPTGQWDSCGALFCDLPKGGTSVASRSGDVSPGARMFGAPSVRDGGPFDVGLGSDQHRLGTTQDGEPINPLHISTEALFLRPESYWEDAPLDFETKFRLGGDLDFPVAVHCAFSHEYLKWKWYTTSYLFKITPITPADPQPPPELPGSREPSDPPPPGDPESPGGSTEPVPEEGDDWNPDGDQAWRDEWRRQLEREGTWIPGRDPHAGKTTIAAVRETQYPTISFRPGYMGEGEPDLRYTPGSANGFDVAAHNATAPTVCRMDSYGAIGGKPGGPYFSYSGGSTRLPGGSFNYTQAPGDKQRHRGGTCRGGVVFMPPEVDLEKIDEDLAPNGLDLSDVFMIADPETRWGAGLPELADGGLRRGFSWGNERGGTGDLVFYTHDETGTEVEAFRLTGTVGGGVFGHTLIPHAEIEFGDAGIPFPLMAGVPVQLITPAWVAGTSKGATAQPLTSNIAITSSMDYQITASVSLEGDGIPDTYAMHIYVNGVRTLLGSHQSDSLGAQLCAMSTQGQMPLLAGDVLAVYLECVFGVPANTMIFDAALSVVGLG